MRSKIKTAISLLKAGNFREVFIKTHSLICKALYLCRARIEDWRLGRISINKRIPSRFTSSGSNATQSSDYRLMDEVFKVFPLKKDDFFVDVGCGEGRVLTYLYLRGFRGEMVGIELDEDIANTAKKRTSQCSNIRILCSNVLHAQKVIQKATVLYLFNPFNETILNQFIQMVEDHCDHPVTMYYYWDVHRKHLDKRENWYILRRNVIKKTGMLDTFYTIYQYRPPKDL